MLVFTFGASMLYVLKYVLALNKNNVSFSSCRRSWEIQRTFAYTGSYLYHDPNERGIFLVLKHANISIDGQVSISYKHNILMLYSTLKLMFIPSPLNCFWMTSEKVNRWNTLVRMFFLLKVKCWSMLCV